MAPITMSSLLLALSLALLGSPQSKTGGLQIVVLEGENAVNIIQQKTAVAPLIEVRDRNGLPVAGALVTFSIQGGNVAAFPGAVSTFTAVTNAAGQAAAVAVQPISAGSFSIQVNALFQGQAAVGSIVQSNVVTAAQAAAAGGSAGAGAGGVATGGGGVSGTTLGIVGAAVGGGALAATQLGGGAEASVPTAPATSSRTLTAPVSFTIVHQISFPQGPPCTIDHGITGTLTMELNIAGDVVSGTMRYSGNDAQVAATCPVTRFVSGSWSGNGTVTGTRAALNSRIANSFTSTADIPPGSTNLVQTLAVFEGTFDGTVVSGTFTYEWSSDISGTSTQTTRSRASVPVTLR